jgi:hypothetical protein
MKAVPKLSCTDDKRSGFLVGASAQIIQVSGEQPQSQMRLSIPHICVSNGVSFRVACFLDAASASSSSSSSASGSLMVPVSVLTDSYKASHFLMYPEADLMVAYGEFRGPFQKDKEDSRFVFYGMRYIIDTYVSRQWTEEDVEVRRERTTDEVNNGEAVHLSS